ncbi:MAG: sulfotransferase [Elusimicrobia bacterium]|nr:sulfotransferase [Elusimicrobiota bacterium]
MPKCLVVDDSVFTRGLLKNLLSALGHTIVGEAGDVGPALKAFEDLSPDLVTLDVVMPSGTGVDVLRQIRKTNKKAKVIVVTASGQAGLDKEVIDLGANAILHKPFTAEEFRAKLVTMGAVSATSGTSTAKVTKVINLTKDSIVAAATEQSNGLTDWGEDTSFWQAFDSLLGAMTKDKAVREKDSTAVAYSLCTLLVNRLLIQEYVKNNPKVKNIKIQRPLVIACLQRTGDMLLHSLLARDPKARPFLLYELMIPHFPSEKTNGEDARINVAKEYFILESLLNESYRQMRTQRPAEYDKPASGVYLLANSFATRHHAVQYSIPSYQEWLAKQDMTKVYEYLRLQMQVLLAQRPCPDEGYVVMYDQVNNLYNLGALQKVFPDACVVQTHRRAADAMAEWCAFIEKDRLTRCDKVDPHEIGRFAIKFHLESLKRADAARKQPGAAKRLDVPFDDLMKDPVGVVSRIKKHFGYTESADLKKNIETFMKTVSTPKADYLLDRYGLTKEQIDKEFGPYLPM